MALNDILVKIKKETEEKVKKIKEEAALRLQEIEKEWQKKIAAEKEKIFHQAKQRAEKRNKQEEIKMVLTTKNLILTEKQKILENLWQEVLEELAVLDDEKYLELISNLLIKCPKEKGTIIAAAGREKITDQAIKKVHRQDNLSTQTVKARGGFIYQSEAMEIDVTLEELVKEMKEEINVELTKILFV